MSRDVELADGPRSPFPARWLIRGEPPSPHADEPEIRAWLVRQIGMDAPGKARAAAIAREVALLRRRRFDD